jgi:hypothetical protein
VENASLALPVCCPAQSDSGQGIKLSVHCDGIRDPFPRTLWPRSASSTTLTKITVCIRHANPAQMAVCERGYVMTWPRYWMRPWVSDKARVQHTRCGCRGPVRLMRGRQHPCPRRHHFSIATIMGSVCSEVCHPNEAWFEDYRYIFRGT